jgi:hypothetical protein
MNTGRCSMTMDELVATVRSCGVSYAIVDASVTPPSLTLVCGSNGREIDATLDQVRALAMLYLLPVHVIRVLSPYLRAA